MSRRSNIPAILLGGGANAVSVARSLARAGIPVHAAGYPASPVRSSRACTTFTEFGTDEDLQEWMLEWLSSGPREGVLLPCADDGLELVARHRAELASWGYVPIEADDDVLLAMLDKQKTYVRARSAGIEVPHTITPQDVDELDDLMGDLAYPCVLKPLHSHMFARLAGTTAKVLVAHNASELRHTFLRMQALGLKMLITETIPGPEDQYLSYYGYMDEHGESLLHFTKRKIRQYPIRFGLSSYQVSEWCEEVADVGLRFFQGVGLRGIGNVEFKRDSRDGRLKLIECNHRFTAANELVQLSGIDLALFTYNRLLGRPLPSVESFREKVYMWHPIQDTRAMLRYRSEGELSLRAWARSLMRRQHFPVARLDDPMPTLDLHARRLIARARRPRSVARHLADAAPSSAEG